MKPQDKKAKRKQIAKKHLEQKRQMIKRANVETEAKARRQLYAETMRTPAPEVLAKQMFEHKESLKKAKQQAPEFFSGLNIKSNQGEFSI